MRFLPFGKSETRAGDSLTDAVLAGLVANAQGNTTARASALGVVEAAAGLWGRAFASAAVTPSSMATSVLDAGRPGADWPRPCCSGAKRSLRSS